MRLLFEFWVVGNRGRSVHHFPHGKDSTAGDAGRAERAAILPFEGTALIVSRYGILVHTIMLMVFFPIVKDFFAGRGIGFDFVFNINY